MFKNYLLMALRNLRKQRGYALINVTGLAIGMACCILILSFILTELSFDRYHEKGDRIYRLIANLTLGNTPNMIATSNPMSSASMRYEFPEVQEVTCVLPFSCLSSARRECRLQGTRAKIPGPHREARR